MVHNRWSGKKGGNKGHRTRSMVLNPDVLTQYTLILPGILEEFWWYLNTTKLHHIFQAKSGGQLQIKIKNEQYSKESPNKLFFLKTWLH